MKKALIYLSCILFCCLLFVYSPSAVSAGLQGFYIWRDALLPALLPFFVCAHVMQNTGVPASMEKSALIALSLFSGAPSGARLLSSQEYPDSRSIAILNTVSPMFIYSSFCGGMLGAPGLAMPILTAQIGGALIMLLLFPIRYAVLPQSKAEISPLRLIGEGITRGMAAMLNICGSLIFFMAIFAAAKKLLPFPKGIWGAVLSGIVEMTSGCTELAMLSLSPRITAAVSALLFSFGGVCIFAQSLTLCRLSAGVYFSTKLLQGSIAAGIAWLITPLFPGACAVYSSISGNELAANALSFLQAAGVSATAIAVVMLIGAAARHRKFFGQSTQKAAE